jgi:hypothetical protein
VTLIIPALSEAFFRMLPWINMTWILNIGLYVFLLRQGRWTPATRWFEIALKIAGIVIVYALLQGPSILAITAADLTKVSIEPSAANTLVNMAQLAVKFALIIAIVAGSAEVVKGVYMLLFKKTPKPLIVK